MARRRKGDPIRAADQDAPDHRLFIETFIAREHRVRYADGHIPADHAYHRLAERRDPRWRSELPPAWHTEARVIELAGSLGATRCDLLILNYGNDAVPDRSDVPLTELGAFDWDREAAVVWFRPGDFVYYVSEEMGRDTCRWLLIRDEQLREKARRLIDAGPTSLK